jgi:hypothetical protein
MPGEASNRLGGRAVDRGGPGLNSALPVAFGPALTVPILSSSGAAIEEPAMAMEPITLFSRITDPAGLHAACGNLPGGPDRWTG